MKTAKQYLDSDASEEFKRICSKAYTQATKRQVRKFLQKRGKAYKSNVAPNFSINLN
jgi:hypothetical protein